MSTSLSRSRFRDPGGASKNVRLHDFNAENPQKWSERGSQIKRITREAVVLRWMRRSRRISMLKAGAAIGVTSSAISHYEQGRMDLPKARIPELLQLYGYTPAEYEEFVMGKGLPVLNIRDECEQMIARIPEGKLKPLHAVLLSFLS